MRQHEIHKQPNRSQGRRRSVRRNSQPPLGPPAVNLTQVRPVAFTKLATGVVVYASIPFEEDRDESKSRPAVVVEATRDEVTLYPITSKGARAAHRSLVRLVDAAAAGLDPDKPSWIRLRPVIVERRFVGSLIGRLGDADAELLYPSEVA